MMKKSIVITCLFVAVTGCASQATKQREARFAEISTYVSTQRPLAHEGKIKWSDYYSGLRERDIAAGASYDVVHVISLIMSDALQFENGSITQSDFQLRQRNAAMTMQDIGLREQQQAQAKDEANRAIALQYLMSHPIAPATNTFIPISPSVTNLTPPAPAALPLQTQGVSAFWTGKQQQVQTVTNQYGWSCEYNYAGKMFWRTFVGACPGNVQVQ